jgi:carotenoid cleavage dioxygenase-like enzyme
VKYDLATGRVERRSVPEAHVVDTPLFVRDPEGRSDEEGWVVVPGVDRTTGTPTLWVLDATRFSGAPEATVSLPQRLPLGIRGLHLDPNSYR